MPAGRESRNSRMGTQVEHCPFLNRADRRCSGHFNLNRLDHALEHCFDRYDFCPVYLELLMERKERRGEPVFGSPTLHVSKRLVQISLPARVAKQPA